MWVEIERPLQASARRRPASRASARSCRGGRRTARSACRGAARRRRARGGVVTAVDVQRPGVARPQRRRCLRSTMLQRASSSAACGPAMRGVVQRELEVEVHAADARRSAPAHRQVRAARRPRAVRPSDVSRSAYSITYSVAAGGRRLPGRSPDGLGGRRRGRLGLREARRGWARRTWSAAAAPCA